MGRTVGFWLRARVASVRLAICGLVFLFSSTAAATPIGVTPSSVDHDFGLGIHTITTFLSGSTTTLNLVYELSTIYGATAWHQAVVFFDDPIITGASVIATGGTLSFLEVTNQDADDVTTWYRCDSGDCSAEITVTVSTTPSTGFLLAGIQVGTGGVTFTAENVVYSLPEPTGPVLLLFGLAALGARSFRRLHRAPTGASDTTRP